MIDHLVDLESDFSAIHRVDDIYSMPGPRFFQFATRIPAYAGVMQALAQAEAEKKHKKYKGQEVEEKSLDELQKVKGADNLFKVTRVGGGQDG